jgi:RNA polymerase sigma factor (sigma-70 family)
MVVGAMVEDFSWVDVLIRSVVGSSFIQHDQREDAKQTGWTIALQHIRRCEKKRAEVDQHRLYVDIQRAIYRELERQPVEELLDDLHTTDSQNISDAKDFLKEKVKLLTNDERDVIGRLYWTGQSLGEIASETGTAKSTVHHRQKRALEKLRGNQCEHQLS